MNRRSFLRRLGVAVVGLTLARTLPGIAPKPIMMPEPPQLAFDADAFAKAMHIQYDPNGPVPRFDILFGLSQKPDFACRVLA